MHSKEIYYLCTRFKYSNGIVFEAPGDGKTYGRNTGEWIEVSQGADNSVFLSQYELAVLLQGAGTVSVALCERLLDAIVHGKDILVSYHDQGQGYGYDTYTKFISGVNNVVMPT
ncbi:MAG: hypothetical protein LBJ17_02235 [Dysgonamonadaceae bacterium]|jgi:hypothetical protein|nr:hypothetical protein [Dysgonamonadaceae bacterium]